MSDRAVEDDGFRGRFWARVKKGPGCWLWTGHRTKEGYGVITLLGRAYLAHRVAYVLSGRRLRAGMHVLHTCDTRACVRGDHLLSGHPRENAWDAILKGRRPQNDPGEPTRHQRYDLSPKGKRRRKRYESSAARLAYRAKWMRDRRKRAKAA